MTKSNDYSLLDDSDAEQEYSYRCRLRHIASIDESSLYEPGNVFGLTEEDVDNLYIDNEYETKLKEYEAEFGESYAKFLERRRENERIKELEESTSGKELFKLLGKFLFWAVIIFIVLSFAGEIYRNYILHNSKTIFMLKLFGFAAVFLFLIHKFNL